MKTITNIIYLGFAAIAFACFALSAKAQGATAEPAKPGEATRARLSESYGKLPLSFEANAGQTNPNVKFLSRGSGYSLFLTNNEAVLTLTKSDNATQPVAKIAAQSLKPKSQSAILRAKLVGANPAAKVTGQDDLSGKVNYFLGNDPTKWRTNVPTYGKVRYEEVYPGIDLVYYGNDRQIEYDFVVQPGRDPARIQLAFSGARKMRLDEHGALELQVAGGVVHWMKPAIYQEINGKREAVNGKFALQRGHKVTFRIAAYDVTKPLIIDPILVYSSYLGGSRTDIGSGIAVDGSGAAYVVGATTSLDFPTTAGAYQTVNREPYDVFITKINAAGSSVVYSTYLGGSGSEGPSGPATVGIALDSAGNAYVTGGTSSFDFPTTPGAFQPTMGGSYDAFITKLNSTGSALVYSTFLGGNNPDSGYGIRVDSLGNAYVTGYTTSGNFPTTPGAFQTVATAVGFADAFVSKLNADASSLIYSTYLGGSNSDVGTAVALDSAGNAYVSGFTDSTDFPTTLGAFQTSYGGARDTFVAKLNTSGSALVYSTYLGGSGDDANFVGNISGGIAVDSAGNAYVVGTTSSSDFPTTAGAFQPTLTGGQGCFVAKVNTFGSALAYCTCLGGGGDNAFGVAVDSEGNAWVTGFAGPDFPTTPGAFQPSIAAAPDGFVTKFNSAGSGLVFSSYLGGGGYDKSGAIALDPAGNAYVTGFTYSTDFPTTPGSFQIINRGEADAFVAKIDLSVTPTPTPTPTPPAHAYSAQVQPPINADGTSVFTVRRGVVPVKFTLTDFGSPTCILPPATIAVTRTAGGVMGEINESVYSGPADNGSNFRIDGCQYIYNLSASSLGIGTYRLDIKINNQVVGSAMFELK